MSSKIINIVVVFLLAICVAERANAGLIVGDLYTDNLGAQWQYVGSFDLADGPDKFTVDDITPLNGLEAAEIIFGTLISGNYALSSNGEADYANIANFIVNHKAWYDAYDERVGIHETNESAIANKQGDQFYDSIGDISAYIWDRAILGENINHVFKSATVPEPSTLAIFSLALVGLIARRLKKQ